MLKEKDMDMKDVSMLMADCGFELLQLAKSKLLVAQAAAPDKKKAQELRHINSRITALIKSLKSLGVISQPRR